MGQARLLDPATRDFMWADAGNGFTKGGFGYGETLYGFGGRSHGGSAYAEYQRDREITIVYAFNVDPPTYLSSSGKDEGWLDLSILRDLVYRARDSGALDEDLWSLAGYTEPF